MRFYKLFFFINNTTGFVFHSLYAFPFSILVDINRLVRIVQFMHIVYMFCVWMPEAVLFLSLFFFYGDNYILVAVYLLVLMDLNIAKLVTVYQVLPCLDRSYQ